MSKLIDLKKVREMFAQKDTEGLASLAERIMGFYGLKEAELNWEDVFWGRNLVAHIPLPIFSGPCMYRARCAFHGPDIFQDFNCAFLGGKSFGGIPVISPYEWYIYVKPHKRSKGVQIFLRDETGISRSISWLGGSKAPVFPNWKEYDNHLKK